MKYVQCLSCYVLVLHIQDWEIQIQSLFSWSNIEIKQWFIVWLQHVFRQMSHSHCLFSSISCVFLISLLISQSVFILHLRLFLSHVLNGCCWSLCCWTGVSVGLCVQDSHLSVRHMESVAVLSGLSDRWETTVTHEEHRVYTSLGHCTTAKKKKKNHE